MNLDRCFGLDYSKTIVSTPLQITQGIQDEVITQRKVIVLSNESIEHLQKSSREGIPWTQQLEAVGPKNVRCTIAKLCQKVSRFLQTVEQFNDAKTQLILLKPTGVA